MIKNIKKHIKKNNQGNTFIMIIATLSFLAVLVAALLVAVALCYRLKAYDVNAKDNFYYLEQAMDEIYGGVGADSMTLLNKAYDDTLETMVYYDTTSKSYVTMENKMANEIMKRTFIQLVSKDTRYDSQTHVQDRLKEFLSYPYVAGGTDKEQAGVQVSLGGYSKNNDGVYLENLVLKREAPYSTLNAKKVQYDSTGAKSADVPSSDTFIQTITTDLYITKPEFDVKFNAVSSDLNELYKFSMVCDQGVEITSKAGSSGGNAKKVAISGNIYAASDFYNKNYNENPKVSTITMGSKSVDTKLQRITSKSDDDMKIYNGVSAKSMYSGFYIDGADVTISTDNMVVPGAIAVMNVGDLTIASVANTSVDNANVWADEIVLDGYSLKKGKEDYKGSTFNLKGNAFIYDDLELNATGCEASINGNYYGYNYATTDNRVYKSSVTSGRLFTVNTAKGLTDAQGIEGQAHYNSSAIIINGQDSVLDFEDTANLYIAGQSYIEVSKTTTKEKTPVKVAYDVVSDDGKNKVVTTGEEDVYLEKDAYPTTTYDATKKQYDNYTVKSGSTDKTAIQDVRTGEALSVKSNQLAYIPNWAVHDDTDGMWLELPEKLRTIAPYKDMWDEDDLAKIPVIKSVVSGKKYYFFDFSTIKKDAKLNEFIAAYAKLFDTEDTTMVADNTIANENGLIDITNYEYFKVKSINVKTEVTRDKEGKATVDYGNNIYTNSAITSKDGTNFVIKAKETDVAAVVSAANAINSKITNGGRKDTVATTGAEATIANNVTTKLNEQYKEMKWLLTAESTVGEYVSEAHNLSEDYISPINHYFDFSLIKPSNSKCIELKSGYNVWYASGDVVIGASHVTINGKRTVLSEPFKNGKVRGIVICKGDVSFEDDVTSFEGLIVTGSKIIVDNFNSENKRTMNFVANEEIVKTVLRECDASRGEEHVTDRYGYVCDTFTLFESQYVAKTESGFVPTEKLTDISAVQFEDILSFHNWKKNVD